MKKEERERKAVVKDKEWGVWSSNDEKKKMFEKRSKCFNFRGLKGVICD
jgi:hypothetical protein